MFWQLYLIALGVFTAIDMVWLVAVAPGFYKAQIGHLMAKQPNVGAAIVFYLLFIAALVFFVISPAHEKKSWMMALTTGAFFGLVTYATYDLTNLATLNKWPLTVTVVDLIWGTALSATVSVLTVVIARKFGI